MVMAPLSPPLQITSVPDMVSTARDPSPSPSPSPSPVTAKPGGCSDSGELRRHVTKFEDRYGMVLPYCGYFEFEFNPDYDYTEDLDFDDDEDKHDRNHVEEPIPTLIKYVAQIRKSFGFDVDCIAPSWFEGVFVPFDLSKAPTEYPEYYKSVLEATDFAMTEINSDTKMMIGKEYKLVELVKVVRGKPWMKLLTLKVKEIDDGDSNNIIIQAIVYEKYENKRWSWELLQWRFKPVDDEPWYQPPPIEEEFPFLKSNAAAATDA